MIALLTDHGIRYCVVGGQGVNAYAEPVVSLDLDIVIAVEQLPNAEALLGASSELSVFLIVLMSLPPALICESRFKPIPTTGIPGWRDDARHPRASFARR